MKLQFKTSTLLLAIAVVAISCFGMLVWQKTADRYGGYWLSGMLLFGMPIWIPLAFIGFAIGRCALTVRMVITFMVVEALAAGSVYWGTSIR